MIFIKRIGGKLKMLKARLKPPAGWSLAGAAALFAIAGCAVVETILKLKPHPEQGFRSCLGILRLAKRHGNDRLELACKRAQAIEALSYRSIKSIIDTGLDREPLLISQQTTLAIDHANIRGPDYYD